LATGHYIRKIKDLPRAKPARSALACEAGGSGGSKIKIGDKKFSRYRLLKAKDKNKNQSYFFKK